MNSLAAWQAKEHYRNVVSHKVDNGTLVYLVRYNNKNVDHRQKQKGHKT